MRKSGFFALLVLFPLVFSCSTKKPADTKTKAEEESLVQQETMKENATPALPECRCICMEPVEVVYTEPELTEEERDLIGQVATTRVAYYFKSVIPPEIEFKKPGEVEDPSECDKFFRSQIVSVNLVSKEDTAQAAAASVVGTAAMLITGIGFFQLPGIDMVLQAELEDTDGSIIWQKSARASRASISLKEDYAAQSKSLVQMAAPKLARQFPYQEEDD